MGGQIPNQTQQSNNQQQQQYYQHTGQYFYPIQHMPSMDQPTMMHMMEQKPIPARSTIAKAKNADAAKKMRAKKDVRLQFLEERVHELESENDELKKGYEHRVKENDLLNAQLSSMRKKLSGLEDRLMVAIENHYESDEEIREEGTPKI
jgi:predicted  nucleic acid-binding Zn-ribbon protein